MAWTVTSMTDFAPTAGTRVAVWLGTFFGNATVLAVDPLDSQPYLLRFDDGDEEPDRWEDGEVYPLGVSEEEVRADQARRRAARFAARAAEAAALDAAMSEAWAAVLRGEPVCLLHLLPTVTR